MQIHLEVFFREGIGCLVGRIKRASTSRLAQFGKEVDSVEEAELKLLEHCLLPAYATNEGGDLEIYSKCACLTDWINGGIDDGSHWELKTSIRSLLNMHFSNYSAHLVVPLS
ncbi:hypothetical protein ACFFKJ_04825 [Pelagicoccus mobilis]